MTTKLRTSLQITLLAAAGSIFFSQHAEARSVTPPTNATGAPGTTLSCVSCHGGSGNGTVSVSLLGGATDYTPGQMYTLMVTVNDPGRQRFGFSLVARDADNASTNVGTLAANGPNTQVYSGGTHAGHANAPFNSGSFTFTIDWTAPSSGVGDVRFYVGAVGANGTGNSGGDSGYLTTFNLSEAVPAPTPATLSGLFREPDGTAKFTLTGGVGEVYTLEYSEDLAIWKFLEAKTMDNPDEEITDADAAGTNRRFYRATPGAPSS